MTSLMLPRPLPGYGYDRITPNPLQIIILPHWCYTRSIIAANVGIIRYCGLKVLFYGKSTARYCIEKSYNVRPKFYGHFGVLNDNKFLYSESNAKKYNNKITQVGTVEPR